MSCAANVNATPLTGANGRPPRPPFSPAPSLFPPALLQTRRELADREHDCCRILACHLAPPGDPCFTREQILKPRVNKRNLFASPARRSAAISLGHMSPVEAAYCMGGRISACAQAESGRVGKGSGGERYFDSGASGAHHRFLYYDREAAEIAGDCETSQGVLSAIRWR